MLNCVGLRFLLSLLFFFIPHFPLRFHLFFFFNDPATPEFSPLSLHDPLPIPPAMGSTALDTANVRASQDYSWDVTSYVKAQQSAGASTVVLALGSAGTTTGLTLFGSREIGRAHV